MHDSDSRFRVSFRHGALVFAILISLIMLWKMYEEQDKIDRCTKSLSKQEETNRVEAVRPIQVVIQNPFKDENKSSLASDRPTARDHSSVKWDYNWDRKQWTSASEAFGVPARTIVLVRHGKYDLNTGLLTDIGKIQANLTGARLHHMGMKFSRIIHSSLDRARETAEIIVKHLSGLQLEKDNILEEGGPLPPDPTISYWGLPIRNYHVNGPRLESAFRQYFYRADKTQTQQSYELIVGHANVFRFFILRALQLEPSAWMRIFISHASITLIHINADSTVTMTRCGDSGHLPNDLVTF